MTPTPPPVRIVPPIDFVAPIKPAPKLPPGDPPMITTAQQVAQQLTDAQVIKAVAKTNPKAFLPDTTTKQFEFDTYALKANTPLFVGRHGDYIFVDNSNIPLVSPDRISTSIQVKARTSNDDILVMTYAGQGYTLPKPFNWLLLTSTQDCLITLGIGYGRAQNDAMTRYCVGLGDTTNLNFTRPANVTPYAANQLVSDGVSNGLEFVRVSRFPNSAAVITRARMIRQSTNNVNADFTLYLVMGNPGVLADQAAFALQFSFGLAFQFQQAAVRFNSWVTGGAGSDSSICDIAGIALPVKTTAASAPQVPVGSAPNLGGGGSLFAVLVANAAYVPANAENIRIDLLTDKY